MIVISDSKARYLFGEVGAGYRAIGPGTIYEAGTIERSANILTLNNKTSASTPHGGAGFQLNGVGGTARVAENLNELVAWVVLAGGYSDTRAEISIVEVGFALMIFAVVITVRSHYNIGIPIAVYVTGSAAAKAIVRCSLIGLAAPRRGGY
jgi:hypothetical protein